MFVLDMHGQPLQPCHPARARKLLSVGRAVAVRHAPFVIKLRDRKAAASQVDGVELGVDPGSKYTGIAMFTTSSPAAGSNDQTLSRRGCYSVEIQHRGAIIRDRLVRRATYRRGRRSRNLRHRAPRFNNRVRPQGWLAPSLRHRVETTFSWVNRLTRWAPVRAIHLELSAFDTQFLQTPGIAGIEYQHGTLHGFEVREYLLAKFGRSCAYCASSGIPLNIDHVRPRSRGGSDRISNLVMACVPCNQAKGSKPLATFLQDRPSLLGQILEQTKAPLADSAAVSATRWAIHQALIALGVKVYTASGGRTKWNRTRSDLAKTHTLDALAVGNASTIVSWPAVVLIASAAGRGRYQRTQADKHGFPRFHLTRIKKIRGFSTGDLVRAVVPTGKYRGAHNGRVAVRTTGKFDIRTASGLVQGIHHRHCRLLQRADGYGYAWKEEGAVRAPRLP